MVGLFPENAYPILHLTGATISFITGGGSLIILGFGLNLKLLIRIYTFISGVVSLSGALSLIPGSYYGFGEGMFERIAIHAVTLWLIVFGALMLRRDWRLLVTQPPHGRRH
jgi:hypothetical protein